MARDGISFVIPALFLTLFFLILAAPTRNSAAWAGFGLFLILTGFLIFFFRDPRRKIPADENLVLAPADGKVLEIVTFQKTDSSQNSGYKIGIFLSLWNVHINRAPVSGKVCFIRYSPGKFWPAFWEKAALENEKNEIGIENGQGEVKLTQIVGVLARRIVCSIKENDLVKSGEKVGLIKFGSRVELFLPENAELKVKLGDKVKAGESVVGVFSPNAGSFGK